MRKIFALLLSLLLVVSVIAGCSASKKTTDAGSTKITISMGNEKQNNSQQIDNSKKLTAKNTNNANSDANIKANSNKISVSRTGFYTDKEHVAAYINEFRRLPNNYINLADYCSTLIYYLRTLQGFFLIDIFNIFIITFYNKNVLTLESEQN